MSKKKNNKEVVIAEMSNAALKQEISGRKKELLALRFKQKIEGLGDTSLFKKSKKHIARVFTELNKRNKSKE